MTKTIIRKSNSQKLWLGVKIANGKKAGFVEFINEKKETIFKIWLAAYSGYLPCDDEFMPYFLTPIRLRSLRVRKPVAATVQSFFVKPDSDTLYIYSI